MSLYEDLCDALPELTADDFLPDIGTIILQDDSDGLGAYIVKWDYKKPLPKGFSLGK